MKKIDLINKEIKKSKEAKEISVKQVSDAYHTFGDLYKHRLILFCTLCNTYSDISWKSRKHFDEENDPMFDGDFVAGINTPTGTATYHIKNEYWDFFNVKEIDRAPEYDNYSGEDVMERILSLNGSDIQKKLKR